MHAANNSSSLEEEQTSESSSFVIAVNMLMLVVVFTFLCNLPAFVVLTRPAMRRKIMTPFMVNMCVVSLLWSIFGDCVSLGSKSGTPLAYGTQSALCTWFGFINLFFTQAFAATVGVMNCVSHMAATRISRDVTERMQSKSKVLVLLALWLYCLVLSAPATRLNIFVPSALLLTCQPNWPSQISNHIVYNSAVFITVLVVPTVVCLVAQYLFRRTVRNARRNCSQTILVRLLHRQKANRLVLVLTALFFASLLPQYVASLTSMLQGCHALVPRTALVLELLAKLQVISTPVVYVVVSKMYRLTLFQLLSGNPRGPTSGTTGQRIVPAGTQRGQQGAVAHQRILSRNTVGTANAASDTSSQT